MILTHQIDSVTIIYQTGCWYREHGQIIVARQFPEGITFWDMSRGIYGCMKCRFDAFDIQQAYLKNEYSLDVDQRVVRQLMKLANEHKDKVPTWRS